MVLTAPCPLRAPVQGLLGSNMDGDQGPGHNSIVGVLAALIGTIFEFYDFSGRPLSFMLSMNEPQLFGFGQSP